MKRLLILLAVLFMFSGISYAENMPIGWEKPQFSGINLAGDTIYLVDAGEFSPAVGYQIATIYNGMIEFRAEYVPYEAVRGDEDNKVGLGIGVNIPQLFYKIGGTWKVQINPTLGVLALVDLDDTTRLQVAPYLNVINLKF